MRRWLNSVTPSGVVDTLAVAVLAGCGRIGFGSNDDRDGPMGDAPPMPDAYVCVAGMDACNGIDDDCDGELDEDCACTPFTLRVALDIDMLESPALAWTGDGYVVGTSQGGRLYLQRVAETGTLVGAPAAVSSGALVGPTSAVYTGADVVLTWTEGDLARIGVMSPTAARTVADRSIGHKDEGPFLAWNGAVLAMVSVQTGFGIDFSRYNGRGDYGGGIGLVGINDEVRSLSWVGTGFAAGMRERTNPRSARFYDWSADALDLGSLRVVGGNRVGFVGAATAGGEGALGSALVDSSGVVLVPHDLSGTATAPEQVVLPNAARPTSASASRGRARATWSSRPTRRPARNASSCRSAAPMARRSGCPRASRRR